jgi:hypothetical protein
MMRRSALNFVVDLVTLLAILVMIATGLIIRFVLPPGSGGHQGEGGLVLWSLGRHDWGDVHFWTSVAFGALLVVHVALHWSWVCTMVRGFVCRTDRGVHPARRQSIYGVGFLLLLALMFGGFTWYADTAVTHLNARGEPVSRPDGEYKGSRDKPEASHEIISGSMTLSEVETATGVSVDTLKYKLGLPQSTSRHERLGRLARQHGISMENIRDIVSQHRLQVEKQQ